MELLFLTGKRTPLYPQTERLVKLLDKDIFDRIQKWIFFNAINGLEIDDYFGKRISYGGIPYAGSVESVFWHYFPPFFQHEIPKVLQKVNDICMAKNLEPDEYVEEAADLLKVMVSRLWKEIAKTHQRLKGKGFPKDEDLKDMSSCIAAYRDQIDVEVKSVLFRKEDLPNTPQQKPQNMTEDIVDVKPNFMGVGLNLNAGWRWLKQKIKIM